MNGFKRHPDSVIVTKKWGYERQIINRTGALFPAGYTLKELTILPNGNACSIHFHALKHETFHITQGSMYLQILCLKEESHSKKSRKLILDDFLITAYLYRFGPGATFSIDPRTAHRFWAAGRAICVFNEVSTADDVTDSYRLVASGPMPNIADFIILTGDHGTER